MSTEDWRFVVGGALGLLVGVALVLLYHLLWWYRHNHPKL